MGEEGRNGCEEHILRRPWRISRAQKRSQPHDRYRLQSRHVENLNYHRPIQETKASHVSTRRARPNLILAFIEAIIDHTISMNRQFDSTCSTALQWHSFLKSKDLQYYVVPPKPIGSPWPQHFRNSRIYTIPTVTSCLQPWRTRGPDGWARRYVYGYVKIGWKEAMSTLLLASLVSESKVWNYVSL